jgi:hypothetical protein
MSRLFFWSGKGWNGLSLINRQAIIEVSLFNLKYAMGRFILWDAYLMACLLNDGASSNYAS